MLQKTEGFRLARKTGNVLAKIHAVFLLPEPEDALKSLIFEIILPTCPSKIIAGILFISSFFGGWWCWRWNPGLRHANKHVFY
jgi:hypothetical protein